MDTKITAVTRRLISGESTKSVSASYGVSNVTILNWCYENRVLIEVARKRNVSLEYVIDLRNKDLKTGKNRTTYSFETKVNVAAVFIYSDKTSVDIANAYKTGSANVCRWYRDNDVLAEIAKRKNVEYENVIRTRDKKIQNSKVKINPLGKKINYETKVGAVCETLINNKPVKEVEIERNLSRGLVNKWWKQKNILEGVAKRQRIDYEALIKVRDKILERKGYGPSRRRSIKTKADAVEIYIFSNKTAKNTGFEFKVRDNVISKWYNNEKVLHEIAKRRGLAYEQVVEIRDAKLGRNIIRSPKELIELIESDEWAKEVAARFGMDEADMADIYAAQYIGRLSRDDAARFLLDPSVRDYLGGFTYPPTNIEDIVDPLEHLLPIDKNGVIKDIIMRKAIEYRRRKLGPNPTEEQKRSFIEELEAELVK